MKKSDSDHKLVMPMNADQFRAWRKSLGMKQKDAADALGLKKRMIQYYEKGKRDDKHVIIPKTVRLACYALSHGIADFDGENIFTDAGEPLPDTEHSDAGAPAVSDTNSREKAAT